MLNDDSSNYFIVTPENPENYKITGCFMDDDKRFIFIHIYKNASISVRNILGMRGKYYEYQDVKDCSGDTICVLRHPYDRIISAYQYLLRLEGNGFLNQHPTFLTKQTLFYSLQKNPIKSFTSFLIAIDNNNFYDAVTYPQVDFLKDRGLTIDAIDNVFIQERIEEDFEKFKIKYDLDKDLVFPRDNRSDDKITKLLKDFVQNDNFAKEIIHNLYKADFEIYNKLI